MQVPPNYSLNRAALARRPLVAGWLGSLGVKTVRRTLSTHSSCPDAGLLPPGIDRALRLVIPLPVLIRNDQGESDGQA